MIPERSGHGSFVKTRCVLITADNYPEWRFPCVSHHGVVLETVGHHGVGLPGGDALAPALAALAVPVGGAPGLAHRPLRPEHRLLTLALAGPAMWRGVRHEMGNMLGVCCST